MGKHSRDRSRSPKYKMKKSKHSTRKDSSPNSESSVGKRKMSFEEELQNLKDERRFGLIIIAY